VARFPNLLLSSPEAGLVLVVTIVTGTEERDGALHVSHRCSHAGSWNFSSKNVRVPERRSRRWGSAGSTFYQSQMDFFGHLLFLPSNANRNVNLRSSSNSRPLRHDGDDTAVMIEGSAQQLDTDRGERIASHGSRLRRRISPDVRTPSPCPLAAGWRWGWFRRAPARCMMEDHSGGRGGRTPKTTACCAFAGSTVSFDCGPTPLQLLACAKQRR
jgi:hypothetical protein